MPDSFLNRGSRVVTACPNYQASVSYALDANTDEESMDWIEDIPTGASMTVNLNNEIGGSYTVQIPDADDYSFSDDGTGDNQQYANDIMAAMNAVLPNGVRILVSPVVSEEFEYSIGFTYSSRANLLLPSASFEVVITYSGGTLYDSKTISSWGEILNGVVVGLSTQDDLVSYEFRGDGAVIASGPINEYDGTLFENRPVPYAQVALDLVAIDPSCSTTILLWYDADTGVYDRVETFEGL